MRMRHRPEIWLIAAVCAGIAGTAHAGATDPPMSTRGENDEKPWTRERMESAEPMDMGRRSDDENRGLRRSPPSGGAPDKRRQEGQ
jgi:hypothetical protein